MVKRQILSLATRAAAKPASYTVLPQSRFLTTTTSRHVSSSEGRRNANDPFHKSSSATLGEPGFDHEGSQSRTDNTIVVEYPEETSDFPKEPPVQGRGGPHLRRTLAQFSLEGRTGVVTGGARGLGLVMAQSLVASGADVAIVDLNSKFPKKKASRTPSYMPQLPTWLELPSPHYLRLACMTCADNSAEEEAERSAKEIVDQFKKDNPNAESYDRSKFATSKKEGVFRVPKVTAHHADVSDPESVESTISEIVSAHGQIDHLVTSAGFTENYDAISYPYERMKKLWGVNVDGTYLFATGVAKHLMERNCTTGSMVFIGSMSGSIVNIPQPQAPYNAAKAAVRHLAASLAIEWAHANIRVNCISPGYMLTAL